MIELEIKCTFSDETVTLLLSFFLNRKLPKEVTGNVQSLILNSSIEEDENRMLKENLQAKAHKKTFQRELYWEPCQISRIKKNVKHLEATKNR